MSIGFALLFIVDMLLLGVIAIALAGISDTLEKMYTLYDIRGRAGR